MTNHLYFDFLRLAAVIALLAPNMARADACGDEILRQETKLTDARARGGALPDLPESNFATMHRQPTPSTVAKAKGKSEDKAAATLERARKLHEEGKQEECLRVLKTIELE